MSSGNAGSQGFMAGPERQKRQSRWLWWVYLGWGMFSWVGFTIVAVKVQTRRFVRAAVVSFVLCVTALAAAVIWPSAEELNENTNPDATGDLSTLNGGWVVVAVWIGLIVYGHVLNRDYKEFLCDKDDQDYRRWHSAQAQARAFYAPQAPAGVTAPPYGSSPAPGAHAPSAPPVDVLGVEADRFFATQPPGNAPPTVPPNAPGA
jgi:hypothetical protein